MQRTRTLERIRSCCCNEKAFANMILKKGSSSPSKATMIMLRMIAIENLFRMSVIYLKNNEKELREKMKINPRGSEDAIIQLHRDRMDDILGGFYPPDNDDERKAFSDEQITERKFGTLEGWVGHDLFVNALAAGGKAGGTSSYKVFESNVDPDEWKDFENSEIAEGREKPDLHAQYPKEKKQIEKGRKGNSRSDYKERGNPAGKFLCKIQIPGNRTNSTKFYYRERGKSTSKISFNFRST